MNKINTLSILIIFFLLGSAGTAFSQRIEKTLREVFDHTSSTVIEVESKFGEVEILQREESKVEVIATIWVESSRDEDAKALLSELSAEISREGDKIIVKSLLPEKISNRRDTKFRIDFKVFTPADVDLILTSKYGSTFIENITGHASIAVAYGNFTARSLGRGNDKPLNNLDLDYSTGNIEEAGWMKLDLSYSKLSIDQATAIVIISKYSSLSIEETSSLVMESKYDTYSIGEINNFLGNLKYGNLKIGELKKKIEIESQYTSAKITEVAQDFDMIKINNQRGGYKIGINDEASFRITGTAQQGDISVNGMEEIEYRTENSTKYLDGQYGTSPSATIDLVVKQGSVHLVID